MVLVCSMVPSVSLLRPFHGSHGSYRSMVPTVPCSYTVPWFPAVRCRACTVLFVPSTGEPMHVMALTSMVHSVPVPCVVLSGIMHACMHAPVIVSVACGCKLTTIHYCEGLNPSLVTTNHMFLHAGWFISTCLLSCHLNLKLDT